MLIDPNNAAPRLVVDFNTKITEPTNFPAGTLGTFMGTPVVVIGENEHWLWIVPCPPLRNQTVPYHGILKRPQNLAAFVPDIRERLSSRLAAQDICPLTGGKNEKSG